MYGSRRQTENPEMPSGSLTFTGGCDKIKRNLTTEGGFPMEHIQTLNTRNLCESAKNGGCGECQTSCQSACKTSCGIANQQCENKAEKK